ncbi:MAG: LapA family protein [Nitrospirae bacterium]|nr:LapA family protein [Nitrospirota bacterium]
MKTKGLVILMFIGILVVFLDENNNPVPLKFVLGSPAHVPLSLIIIVSIVVGMIITVAGIFFLRKIQVDRAKAKELHNF